MSFDLKSLLHFVIKHNASDLHLTVGSPPVLRINGGLRPLKGSILQPEDTAFIANSIMPERCKLEVEKKGATDFGFAFENLARFRTSVYKQKGKMGIALRLIPSKMLTFEEIGLSPIVKDLLNRPRGLILVTGPTGCGKTTTLASMIDYLNKNTDCHIVTIEDPIEYYHEHQKSIITQREIPVDVSDFAEGLRSSLRMDPDVVLVGEMRDVETMSAAITAAETGHLVFATLHTTGAPRTINRIVESFPVGEQEQIRSQLSQALMAVFTQALVPKLDGTGRVAAFEIMINTSAIANLIREKKLHQIYSHIQTGSNVGMITLDDHLVTLYEQEKISIQSVLEYAEDPEEINKKISGTQYKKF